MGLKMVTRLPSRKIMLLTTRFLQLLLNRNFTAAERELERIKQEVKPNEWYQGYINALDGMLVASKSDDKNYAFINRIDKEKVGKLRKEFIQQSRGPLQADFDRGFFTAWNNCLKVLHKSQSRSSTS